MVPIYMVFIIFLVGFTAGAFGALMLLYFRDRRLADDITRERQCSDDLRRTNARLMEALAQKCDVPLVLSDIHERIPTHGVPSPGWFDRRRDPIQVVEPVPYSTQGD